MPVVETPSRGCKTAPYLPETVEARACTVDEDGGVSSYGIADADADMFTVYARTPEPTDAMPDFTPEYALSDHETREEADRAAEGWRAVFHDGPVRVTEQYDSREVGGDDLHTIPAGTVGTVQGYVVEWFDVHVELAATEDRDALHVWVSPDALAAAE